MRINLSWIAFVLLCAPVWSLATSSSGDVVGTWEGESKCTVPDSPCHDEHALYRIAADQKNPAQLNIDAYKIINGSPEFMGAIACEFHASESTLTCATHGAKPGEWEFHVSGDTMTGTLKVEAGKTLYRRISLRKTHTKAD